MSYDDDASAAEGFVSEMDYRAFFSHTRYPGPSSYPSPAEVRAEAKKRVDKIFSDWHLLNHIIQRHEALIQKRWLGKSRPQRKNILTSAWPNMSVYHRPDTEVFFRELLSSNSRAATHRRTKEFNKDPYFWPHINQEDLLKPKLLLIFLNTRARNFPSAFAAADRDSFSFSFTSWKVQPSFLNEHVMMFRGNTPETYGHLYSWDDHPDAYDWLISQRGDQPGKGIQVLEVQERIYAFLLECCLQILHDMPRESLASDVSPIEPEPPALSLIEPGGVISLKEVIATGPYRLPASLDLRRLFDLVEAKKSASEDHFWSMREDPSYFAQVMMEGRDHRQEAMLDTLGQKHSLMRPENSKELWERVFAVEIGGGYRNYMIWSNLSSLIHTAMTLQEKYKHKITPDSKLPQDLLEVLLELQYNLEVYIRAPVQILQTIAVASPPIIQSFARRPEYEEGNNHVVSTIRKPASTKDKTLSSLLALFLLMWDDDQRELCGMSHLLDELDRLVENDPRAKGFLSPLVTSVIEDLSLMAECQRQIELFQPWASTFDTEMVKYKDGLRNKLIKQNLLLDALDLGADGRFPWPNVDPSSSQFAYPVEKRSTKETTAVIQQSERNLDAFWATVDRLMWRKANDAKRAPFSKLLEGRLVYRTPPWVEPVKAKAPSAKIQQKDIVQSLSQLDLDNESSQQPKKKSAKSKSKAKTRGVASSTGTTVASASDPSDDFDFDDGLPKIPVDDRALKVFSTLFYQPSVHNQPGEIPWVDFLHAMGAVGFAIEKLYGSIWHFSPVLLSNKFVVSERSIQFHEPHPVSKIPFRMARQFGRRLTRAYGWNTGTFQLKGVS
ncbi:hypothetical protein BGZ83_000738 [Gryganskiella cystojenkinii]|nr:hypothetical protein BGZ83_000738 [Gryganskiella cystojenkinii]